jgi:hypothetical protein
MKNIKFEYLDEYAWSVCEKPKPSKEFIPQWFKDMPPYMISKENPTGKKLIVENFLSNASAKKCIPMLDGMSAGYTIPLWSDVQVRQVDGGPKITWRVTQDVFELHGPSSREIPAPFGYSQIVFKYDARLRIKTPKGYSILVTSPLGHYHQPFLAIPAIIDTDKSNTSVPFPMWIKSGLEEIVEKGTPMVQIIPFKRDDWKMEITYMKDNEYNYDFDREWKSTIVNNYVKKYWSKKKFL